MGVDTNDTQSIVDLSADRPLRQLPLTHFHFRAGTPVGWLTRCTQDLFIELIDVC